MKKKSFLILKNIISIRNRHNKRKEEQELHARDASLAGCCCSSVDAVFVVKILNLRNKVDAIPPAVPVELVVVVVVLGGTEAVLEDQPRAMKPVILLLLPFSPSGSPSIVVRR